MKANYKIVLTSANNPANCEAEFIHINTSLNVANEARFAEVVTKTLSNLYESQGREMLCMWELDDEGREQKFYQ